MLAPLNSKIYFVVIHPSERVTKHFYLTFNENIELYTVVQ